MKLESLAKEFIRLDELIDQGYFDEAFSGVEAIYINFINCFDKGDIFFKIIARAACIFIDIGHMKPCVESSKKGLSILEKFKDEIVDQIGEDAYFYNLSNAKSNLIVEKDPFNHSFSNIEQLVDIKTDLWRAIKISEKHNFGQADPTYIVNLGNSLKQQFRIAEALECYDSVNLLDLDIPQSWINRSETLLVLNQVSHTYSIQMLEQIKNGYEKVLSSRQVPPQWMKNYKEKSKFIENKIDKECKYIGIELDLHDFEKTKSEYENLSDYRKFCLKNNLSLSEHGLYCSCVGSSRDDLTIPTARGVTGDFIIPMEMVLNRLKSEFSFACHLYFECVSNGKDYELPQDSCFSELFNDELLGLDVERLRTAFRSCFGILDKIAIAVCELFDVYPSNRTVYFQSFWQLDREDRRDKFNKHKNPGLLALYSIATDLNERRDGEWSFLKQLRNDLEHEFVVIHKSDTPSDVYKSYDFMENIVFIREEEFIMNLKRILQLTRSAIFSFVFAVRNKALSERDEDAFYLQRSIYRKNQI
ncbi:LA2681 family HEPN domain-containing protein [Comamonas sp. GB3 AK4-5]|uniref:LA2681 family HEPN domain-containing protein n=1 Tax=Comamonas sp. GB3 AK4-5 TaxID=3231487 RepID=UPI00351F058E